MLMRDAFLPMWLLRAIYNNAWIFKMGFLLALISLGIIAYKLNQARPTRLQQLWLHTIYAGIFFSAAEFILFHPYWTFLLNAMLLLPLLITHIRLALFMVFHYGIGGNSEDSPK
jgi:hypothetical protein